MTIFCGCKKSAKKGVDQSTQLPQPGKVENSSGGSVEPIFEAQTTGFNVFLKNIPADAGSVRCRINDTAEVDCAHGMVLPPLKDGLYLLTMTITTSKESLVRTHQFSILNGQYHVGSITKAPPKNGGSSADPGGAQDIVFALKPGPATEKFSNHSAASRQKPLTFDFVLESNQSCEARFWCSHGQDIWWLCNNENKPSVTLEPRELAAGFQKILIKASCAANSFDTNVVERFWFGVGDDYQPLAVTKREVLGFTHYQIEKATDCLDELAFECGSNSGSFKPCSNVKIKSAKGFQIRAVCKKSGNIERGPVFSET